MRTFDSPPKSVLCFLFVLIVLYGSCSSSSPPSEEVAPPLITDPVDAKAVLFVGNSLTNNNSMAEMVRRMAASAERALLYTQHAPGGTRIADHTASSELETKIASRQWDFVTLQAQSTELIILEESTLESTIYPDIMTLVAKVRSNNNNSIPLFYMTWGLEEGDASLCDPLPDICTFEDMNNLVKQRYLTLMESNNGQVSPCAEIWSVVRERHPEIQLYEYDGRHPSILGSYAVALSFYTMIFKADPTQTFYHRDGLDPDEEQLLKEIVKEVVFDRISEWQAD